MTCLPGLLDTIIFMVERHIAARQHPARGKDRITYALECLGDQGRADRPRRLAAPERAQATLQRRRDRRRREPIAREVDNVLEIVAMTDTCKRVRNDALAIFRAEPDRAADAGVEIYVFGERRQDDAVTKSASTRAGGSSLRAPGCGPTYIATCDQVDSVMYLITELMRRLPSTSHVSRLQLPRKLIH